MAAQSENERMDYEAVAASQTAQTLGGNGAVGDYLSHIVIQPATAGAGTCTVLDGTTVVYTFTTGTLVDNSSRLVPFGCRSALGPWRVTTGANVAILAVGKFT